MGHGRGLSEGQWAKVGGGGGHFGYLGIFRLAIAKLSDGRARVLEGLDVGRVCRCEGVPVPHCQLDEVLAILASGHALLAVERGGRAPHTALPYFSPNLGNQSGKTS